MPNHIQCRLTTTKEIIDSLKGETELDFNTVVLQPKDLDIESLIDVEAAAERALLDFPKTHNITDPADELKAGNYGRLADNLHMSNMMNPKLTPSPLDFTDENFELFITMLRNKREHGHYNWHSWSKENWGTKWNAYDIVRRSDEVIEFQTAWSAPVPVVAALAQKFPRYEIRLDYASEDYGYNLGTLLFREGGVEVARSAEKARAMRTGAQHQPKPASAAMREGEMEVVELDDPDAHVRDLWRISDDEWAAREAELAETQAE